MLSIGEDGWGGREGGGSEKDKGYNCACAANAIACFANALTAVDYIFHDLLFVAFTDIYS